MLTLVSCRNVRKLDIGQHVFQIFATVNRLDVGLKFMLRQPRNMTVKVIVTHRYIGTIIDVHAGFVVLLVAVVANIFLQLPALHLAISALFILFSAGAILWETSNIIHGGETNYIRATVSLYVSLYNIFVSLLSLLGFARSN